MTKNRDPNIDRAGVLKVCRSEWWVVLSIDDEDVIDNKGSILFVCRSKTEARYATLRINAAIRNAVRRDRKGRGK